MRISYALPSIVSCILLAVAPKDAGGQQSVTIDASRNPASTVITPATGVTYAAPITFTIEGVPQGKAAGVSFKCDAGARAAFADADMQRTGTTVTFTVPQGGAINPA